MDDTTPSDRPRRAGRKARIAARAAPPLENPAPPGAKGGQYRPLQTSEMEAIFATALRYLAELGMGTVPQRLATDLCRAGATDAGDGRIRFPEAMVLKIIDQACKRFTLHGRDPARDIEVGGDRVYFGTGGAAVNTLDLDSGLYRPSTLADLHNFTRLQDVLENVAWFTRCCIATDVPDMFDLDVNTAYALLRNTTKPVATAFTIADHVAPIIQMCDIAAGGSGAFAKRPFLKAHVSPIISPMRFGEDAVDVVYACVEHNVPLSCITAAQAGATAPAPLAGFLAQSLAETLASLVMVNVIAPNYPMVFSNWPFVIDLRSGAFAGGGAETALMNAASAQLSNWLGLPSGVAAAMTDAKAIDAQYGIEKGMTSLAAALAGGNLIYESSGMTAALLGVSFEGFVLDNDMHSMSYRALRGIEVSRDTLAFEASCASILGDGHFLGASETYQAMERDYYYPRLADRDAPSSWQETGARDAWKRAHERAVDILTNHRPNYLSSNQERHIRAQLPIVDL